MDIELDSAQDQTILFALRESRFRQAAQYFVDYYSNEVFIFCLKQTRSWDTAEELCYESFNKAFAMMKELRGNTSPKRWIFSIVNTFCQEALERLKAQRTFQVDDAPELGEGQVRLGEALRRRLDVLAAAL